MIKGIYLCKYCGKQRPSATDICGLQGSYEDFAMRKAKEGRMNENYAVLYQEFLSNPKTEGQAKLLAQKLFTHRLYCDDKKIRYVIVRHEQLRKKKFTHVSRA